MAYIDKAIMNEPVEVQLMLLDYSRDKELTLKAWIALSKYTEKAREILLLYGSEPEFKEILINYGESIIPPIQYFRENDVWSVKVISSFVDGIETTKILWNQFTGNEQTSLNSTTQAQTAEFESKQRGWYAVNFIKQEGHHFLGQFVVDKDKKVKWVQTERILEGVTSFFASGLRTLETKYDHGDEITTGDVFWAGVDVAVVAGSLKLLRTGKAVARSGKELSFVSRTRIFASRLLSEGKIFQKLGKYGAEVATAYIIVAHPSLINSAFAEAAKMMGLDPWLIQFAGWSLIITIALYPFSWLLKIFARIVLSVFSWIEQSRKKPIPNIASADSAAS